MQAIAYGTQMVGGVNPKKAGSKHLGLPVFKDVQASAGTAASLWPDGPQKSNDPTIWANFKGSRLVALRKNSLMCQHST